MEIKTKFNIGDEVKHVNPYFTNIKGKISAIHIEEGIIKYTVYTDNQDCVCIREEILELIPKPILDDEERRYLSAVIKPFRKEVSYIRRVSCSNNNSYIYIEMADDAFNLPDFTTGTMYKGMLPGEKYTLEELGL